MHLRDEPEQEPGAGRDGAGSNHEVHDGVVVERSAKHLPDGR